MNVNGVYNVTVTYICKDFSGEIKVDLSEGRDAKFFSIDEIPSNLSSTIKRSIDDFVRNYSEIVEE